VATRLPPEYRLSTADAARLVQEEIFGRFIVHDLPAVQRGDFIRSAALDQATGGRIYDAHIAEVARAAGATVIVTDNRRHFLRTQIRNPGRNSAGVRRVDEEPALTKLFT
jgi:predicted nucleic acid-binding protein